ncbi:hypothetical protein TREES_T100017933 [Tupaia chinensis]|uniref:Uncharacterized protein n=1 Tax=Tupaia chinensis TaxID=246437 RepID=L9JQH5_TUPCH|nr:hypothetical protein TREES_T100017933 [Tupaia chinensis]
MVGSPKSKGSQPLDSEDEAVAGGKITTLDHTSDSWPLGAELRTSSDLYVVAEPLTRWWVLDHISTQSFSTSKLIILNIGFCTKPCPLTPLVQTLPQHSDADLRTLAPLCPVSICQLPPVFTPHFTQLCVLMT